MARRMETRSCAVCGKPFQAAVEGRRTKCEEHKGTKRTRRQAFQSRGAKYERARPGERCTIGGGASGKCGRPGVVAFRSSAGHRYVECERHAPATALELRRR